MRKTVRKVILFSFINIKSDFSPFFSVGIYLRYFNIFSLTTFLKLFMEYFNGLLSRGTNYLSQLTNGIKDSKQKNNENKPYFLRLPLLQTLFCRSNFYTKNFVGIILLYNKSHTDEKNIDRSEQSMNQ